MNPLDKAISIVGGVTALAVRIGVAVNVVSNWRKRGVPIEWCVAIEKATGGVVSRKEFRPNDWRSIWPELINKAA